MARIPLVNLYLIRLVLGGILVALTAAEPAAYAHAAAPGDYVQDVSVGKLIREYRLHIPRGYAGARPLPLIFVFHGSSASASVIERETGFDRRADSLGFIVVYPEGVYRAWNIGECCRYPFVHHMDETAFVTAILNQLRVDLSVDTTRVYATGYSDGATLSYILGCTLPKQIAAVAGISGTLFHPEPACALPRPVSAMIVHGTGDNSIPYSGRQGWPAASKRGPHFSSSAPDVAQFWAQKNRCQAPPDVTVYKTVTREHWNCADHSEVVFYTIAGGSHGWPGGGRGWVFSPEPPKDMVATDSVVKFFWRHHA